MQSKDLLTHGDLNTPRWAQAFDEVSLVLDPRFVADVVRDGLAADDVEFASQPSVYDATVARYAEAFCCELATDSPNGLLYVDTLTIGFAVHLLSNYAVAKPKIPIPGRVSSALFPLVHLFVLTEMCHEFVHFGN